MLQRVKGIIIARRDTTSAPRFVRLREAVAETTLPAVLRGGGVTTGTPDDGGVGTSTQTSDPVASPKTQCPGCKGAGIQGNTLCARCVGAGTIPTGSTSTDSDAITVQESARPATPQLVALKPNHQSVPRRLREADATGGPVYEVELIAEGLGNEKDRVFYTTAALREAATSGVLTGMQAYANHPGKDEEINRPERDVRELVGYYRGFKFKESGSAGKPVVAAELVVNQGDSSQWFVDLLESAIAAQDDGVRLCGISIDGGGLVEVGEVDGQYANICRKITEASSADIVTRPAAGGTIVRRLRESVQRAQLPNPQETPAMKIADVQTKLGAVHTALREAVTKLTTDGATDDQVREALTGLNAGIGEVETLAGAEVEAEVQIREAAVGDKTATALAVERDELQVKLREAESKVTELTSENTSLTRSMLAAQALREAEVDAERAKEMFPDLVRLGTLDEMKGSIQRTQDFENRMFERFRESYGLGDVEGVPARAPIAAPPAAAGDPLAAMGIPTLAEPAAAAA